MSRPEDRAGVPAAAEPGDRPASGPIVRPPLADGPELGKDELDRGWGGEDYCPAARDAEFERRHLRDRPPHHESDWG